MKKILVVEDNEQNRYLLRYMLEQNGYNVLTADSGAEAVAMVVQKKPDLILMDIQLPDMDGLEATRMIRASEAEGRIPIVAVTSFAMAGDREKALEAGCNGYIEKPINPETFLGEIGKYV
ncbi:MAG: two-component system response regulator [Deltaproteobacteria bacterium RBG_13_49_15]|nr:MAG: two-component system response regulator [Deltaproteobacteria bacterium RBG_13_49_15]